ncbi:MAG: hydrogenase expression/formation protein [Burkholderiaceae bacterium]|nr:hydrogenase expression/formation protein [Burkholderiaceae bacterium]
MTDNKIIVMGIGNVLWADEGFGVRCVEALRAHQYTPEIELVDGGTQGLYLLGYVQSATHLLILDAIDYGLEPGTIKVIENDDVPRFMGAKKMSLHQTGFQEVLQVSFLTGKYPEQLVLIGCQPEMLEDYGGSLTECVKSAMPQALELALARLREWGVDVTLYEKVEAVAGDDEQTIMSIQSYEQGRPKADEACRVGDDRFLNIRHQRVEPV